ncbi:fibronectin-binding protein A N-terminus-domain-containing protein [Pseudomassariella vexata]|uniref:Ribosome quality control complex subunit 2 n=1 Tax=Pseudomassariella vexata TaxID=1141098 RepID=A0A1Y2DMS4_9PEZI|nr:fibronectin-binding protein A N-terminus-domain-containing protein [Pseudomassariella vexata]ORY60593.1 fibronectin-binding protein A N-terminus-domain-containing protein [Pseudomassariella vexata]
MKQRFSSLDVKVITHELSSSLVSLRLSNIYDLSSKILLLKFAKPDNKKQLLIDSGFRCHLSDFARTTAAAPSVFVQKLRKALKTRRLTAVSQIGTDRIIEFQFSEGQYRLYLEFFAGGNVILTDNELRILTLLRHVPEGEGQEPQRPGLMYSLENRQNYRGVPPLTKERVRTALTTAVEKAAAAAASAATAGKKIKKKPGDELIKGLATTMPEFPPMLVDHVFKVTEFDSTTPPAAVLGKEELLDHLLRSLEEAQKIVGDITRSGTCKGFILAKKKPDSASDDTNESDQGRPSNLLYEDFHPFLPRQFQDDPAYTVVTFDNFNKTVDDFFSSIEGQKLESKLSEREVAAKRKLEAARKDQAKRIEGLQETQQLNIRKAGAIQANVERVEEAMEAVNGLIAQGMDWVNIEKLIERERMRNNPVAALISLPLKLSENSITLLLGEAEDVEDDVEAYETDSSESDSGYAGTEASKQKAPDRRLAVEINLGLSPWANAREYYDEKKQAAVKEQKTAQQTAMALKNAEQKIAAELKKGLKKEKPILQPLRRQMWFEKFAWFISSDGYLVLGGKDAMQNEFIYRRHLKKGDIYVHADLHGAPSVIIKNNPRTPNAPIPPSTLSQAGALSVCSSSAWDSKAVMPAYWVNADQVSKSTETGEFLPTGSFMIRGKKNFLPPTPLLLGFGLMFRISEESKAKHVKHRLHDTDEVSVPVAMSSTAQASEEADSLIDDNDTLVDGETVPASDSEPDVGDAEGNASEQRQNPLQSSRCQENEDESVDMEEPLLSEDMQGLKISETSGPGDAEHESQDAHQEDEGDDSDSEPPVANVTTQSGKPVPQPQVPKKQQAKRGQRGKAKKIAAKYRDQDDEDRAAIETLIGATAGQKKAEAEAQAKAEREAAQAAAKERRQAQHQRQQRETAKHEEVRRLMLEEGIETLDDDDEADQTTSLDSLIGTPLPGDEILEAIPVCAPYVVIGKLKYKAKLQPGSQKKGKAVKEIFDIWRRAAENKGVVDENSQDSERMWPREVELIRGMKPEEAINSVPVRLLRVMVSGGGGGHGNGGASKGKAKGGQRGKKR